MSTTVDGGLPPVIEAVSRIVCEQPPPETQGSVERLLPTWGQLGTAIALGGIAYASYYAEIRGHTKQLPGGEKAIAESLPHLDPGYIGAFIGHKLSESRFVQKVAPKFYQKVGACALVGATIANFATEAAQALQDGSSALHRFYDPDQLAFETPKDWFVSAVGAGLLLGQQKLGYWWSQWVDRQARVTS